MANPLNKEEVASTRGLARNSLNPWTVRLVATIDDLQKRLDALEAKATRLGFK